MTKKTRGAAMGAIASRRRARSSGDRFQLWPALEKMTINRRL
jgi:hypothetical protein